jgi:chromosome partitioning protein
MSRHIGVLNYKGGTGKTTTVVNLAMGLAMHGARVLCIDLDAQGSLATWFGIKPHYLLNDLLLGKASAADCIVSVHENVDLIASDNNLMQVEGALWKMSNERQARWVLTHKLSDVQDYDFVILDFSPSVSLLAENGLLYVRELILPVAMNYMALVGTKQVILTLKELGRIPDHRLTLGCVVPTFYYGRLRKDREVMDKLTYYFNGKVTQPIRANVKLAEAPGHQQSIYDYAPNSAGARDYMQLVERVLHNE